MRACLRGAAAVIALAAAIMPAAADPCMRGVNLAGAEFGTPPGKLGKDYVYPSDATIAHFAGLGMTTIRLPFRWERLQPELGKPFAETELAALDHAVTKARDAGLTVILDPHNYARYGKDLIGTEAVPAGAFTSFWNQLATHYQGVEGIVFSLMNEPYDISASSWLAIANDAIAAIRSTGADNLILVPGTAYTGAHSWTATLPTGNNSTVMLGVVDPLDNYAYDLHQYLDADFSGRKGECTGAASAKAGIDAVTSWLRDHGKRGFLGEFGVSDDPACIAAMTSLVEAVDAAPGQWLGWTYWAAGDWWPADYVLSAQPTAEGDRAQVKALLPYLKAGADGPAECLRPGKTEVPPPPNADAPVAAPDTAK